MSRADLLIDLVKSASRGDQRTLANTVHLIAADERSKKHEITADRIVRAMHNGMNDSSRFTTSATNQPLSKGQDLILEIVPERKLQDLILPSIVRRVTDELVEEHHRRDLLRSFGLEPRHKILLAGAPGNGKTSFAEALAEKLMVPLYVVRYENLITSYLGETSAKLQELFDKARQTRCVLFFDEFDTVGKERGDTHETGEIKRVVSTLLLQVDRLPSHVVVVAASNHPELLDRAVWRRFDVRFELPLPTAPQRTAFLKSFFERRNLPAPKNATALATKLGDLSFAELEQFCLGILRRHVLSLEQRGVDGLAKEALQEWMERFALK